MKSLMRLSLFVGLVVFVSALFTLRIASAALPSDIPTGTPPPPPTETPAIPTETPEPTTTPGSPTPRPPDPTVAAPDATATPQVTPTVLVTLPDTGGPAGGIGTTELMFVIMGAFMLLSLAFLVWRRRPAQ